MVNGLTAPFNKQHVLPSSPASPSTPEVSQRPHPRCGRPTDVPPREGPMGPPLGVPDDLWDPEEVEEEDDEGED